MKNFCNIITAPNRANPVVVSCSQAYTEIRVLENGESFVAFTVHQYKDLNGNLMTVIKNHDGKTVANYKVANIR